MNTPISKSQSRAIKLLELTETDDYQIAAATLENAGYRRDGIPAGQTWRTAAKMADSELMAGLKAEPIEPGISAINLIECGY